MLGDICRGSDCRGSDCRGNERLPLQHIYNFPFYTGRSCNTINKPSMCSFYFYFPISAMPRKNRSNDCNDDSKVSETPKKISFEAALTALKTMTEFIEQQPDNSFVVREDVVNLLN